MRITHRGFYLLEVVIAMALSSVLLMAAMRTLPTLQKALLHESQMQLLADDLWQLALVVGKSLQRAGYCNGECPGDGVVINQQGDCVLLQWDVNSNGRWEQSSSAQAEQTGYRLKGSNLETLRGANDCDGKNWERINDPALLQVDKFTITLLRRNAFPPLFDIQLTGQTPDLSGRTVSVRYLVSGFNL